MMVVLLFFLLRRFGGREREGFSSAVKAIDIAAAR
jgi:hypothetical protein